MEQLNQTIDAIACTAGEQVQNQGAGSEESQILVTGMCSP